MSRSHKAFLSVQRRSECAVLQQPGLSARILRCQEKRTDVASELENEVQGPLVGVPSSLPEQGVHTAEVIITTAGEFVRLGDKDLNDSLETRQSRQTATRIEITSAFELATLLANLDQSEHFSIEDGIKLENEFGRPYSSFHLIEAFSVVMKYERLKPLTLLASEPGVYLPQPTSDLGCGPVDTQTSEVFRGSRRQLSIHEKCMDLDCPPAFVSLVELAGHLHLISSQLEALSGGRVTSFTIHVLSLTSGSFRINRVLKHLGNKYNASIFFFFFIMTKKNGESQFPTINYLQ
ncbi:hypothetical protein JEQ12_011735 [Ovis aries]|uniref:Uncharacterized protein n=1 Tax=Ovis aries TaxID=9940 RepID=A0A835ZSB5_SHEEP|nr:hypothetical protein JEQ12_011735 [Ovis aries]